MYEYFIQQVHQIAINNGRTPVHWEEVFLHFGKNLSADTIIHIWLDHATLAKVVTAGYRGILSNQAIWYLE
jgi:N-acetyl-beta-hexosaminidase